MNKKLWGRQYLFGVKKIRILPPNYVAREQIMNALNKVKLEKEKKGL